MTPSAALIFSPVGSPVAAHFSGVALVSSSSAGTASATALPTVVACGFGAVMAMVFFAVQVNEADPVALVESVAVTLTVVESAVVTVPAMTPVVLLIASPGGSPVAL